ncbi:MAG TPA: hypothetical protein VN703_08710 [Candidatus Sulfopaludibacter sp.]|nr:hypothetical protein [Candidatus Sulfopaludibacter sp.]
MFFYYLSSIYADSPSITRQEIADPFHDVIKRYQNYTISKINFTNTPEGYIANSTDISHISFVSDGKYLNATLWLDRGFNKTLFNKASGMDFGMYIVVNPNSQTGNEIVDYHKQTVWPPNLLFNMSDNHKNLNLNNSWIDDIQEDSTMRLHRIMKMEVDNNFTNLLLNEFGSHLLYGNSTSSYIPLSLNLKDINFPSKYKVMFYVGAYLGNTSKNNIVISDFSNWINIPLPKFIISTFPNNIELRPGETKNVSGVLKTVDGFIPNVTNFLVFGNPLNVTPKGNSSFSSSSGVQHATFNIQTPSADKIQPGEYVIPISANINPGKPLLPNEFAGAVEPLSSAITTATTNMTVTVLKPLSFSEWFKQGWDVYGQPISIVAAGFVGGATSLLFDRLKKTKKGKEKNDAN